MKFTGYSLLLGITLFISSLRLSGQDLSQLSTQKPFAINGTVGIGLGTYHASGISPREHSFSYLFNGAPVISIYGVSFPFTIVVSDQQRGFRQPFNQYGISPQYKWITLHAGWQSINWSQFTLAGYNLLGAGLELNPGKLRAGFIYGRFNKAIEENAAQPLSFQTPSYKRTGYAARLGYGTERNHIDFTFLHARDDTSSLKTPLQTQLQPAENMVLGLNTRVSFLGHFIWDFEAAGSLYTRNLKSDSIGAFNLGSADFIRNLIKINTSSQFLTAGQTNLAYINKNYNVGVQYRRVDPDYKSMGAYYFETDVANYTLFGGFGLWKNQIRVNASLGYQHDNLMHDKSYESKRSISAFSVSYNTVKYGIDLRYSNYGITQDRGLNPIIDTFRVARTNYNINGVLRYTLSNEAVSHNFILVGNVQSLADLNHFTSAQSESNSKTANLTYQVNFNKSAFGLMGTFNYTLADIYLMHTVLYGPTAGINKALDNSRLSLNAAFSYQRQQNNYKNAGSVINGTLNGSYRLGQRNGASLSFIYLKSNSKDATLPSFHEIRSSLTFTHTF